MILLHRAMLVAVAILAAGPVAAQQTTPRQTPGAVKRPAPEPAPTPAEPAKCASYDAAARTAYAAYVQVAKEDVPDLGTPGADLDALGETLQSTYAKLVDEAMNHDQAALRKLAAIEIFTMRSKSKPIPDITQKKVCALAKIPSNDGVLLDALTCAVIVTDETRRKDAANRAMAQQMMAKAKEALPAKARPTDSNKMLYDDVARGLAGCM